MTQVFVCAFGGGYGPHRAFGEQCNSIETLRRYPEKFSLVVLPGGADIDPFFYGHEKSATTGVSPGADRRDAEAFAIAQENGIPCVGICRGAQFLIAMAGGYLYQHTTGHGQKHFATTVEGQNIAVTSCHHQMFGYPLPEKAKLLAWSTLRRSKCYIVGKDKHAEEPPPVEPECVYLPTINSIATQWHPEWMGPGEPGRQYHEHVVEKYLRPTVAKRFKQFK